MEDEFATWILQYFMNNKKISIEKQFIKKIAANI